MKKTGTMNTEPLMYCNPLPLEHYQRGRACQWPGYKGRDFREMADPTVIRFDGRWYLFPSAGMLWHSDDLVNWTHHPVEPFDPGYAPTVAQKGEWLYLTASWECAAIYRSRHPLGPWEKLGTPGKDADNNPTWLKDHQGNPVRWGDPCLFVDDDGAMFCYCNLARPTRPEDNHPWKLTNDAAIFGVRLRDDDPTHFAEEPRQLLQFNPRNRYERTGAYNQSLDHAILEGPWMNKIRGRYYLQYSVNGTDCRKYAVACAVGDAPLGPFVRQRRNPILIAGEGVVNGTAHHSIVEGPDKTLWCFYTTRVRNEAPCERRIGMDPAGIDENGELFVAGPTETPQYAPGHRSDPAHDNGAGLVPLSVDCWATASSASEGRDAVYAVDNSVNTWWQAVGPLPQWLEVDLHGEYLLHSARTMFADRGLDYKAGVVPGPYRYRILGSRDGKSWELLCDRSANTEERHIALDRFAPARCRRARLEILAVPPGMRTAVWEFTVFGWPQGDEPVI